MEYIREQVETFILGVANDPNDVVTIQMYGVLMCGIQTDKSQIITAKYKNRFSS